MHQAEVDNSLLGAVAISSMVSLVACNAAWGGNESPQAKQTHLSKIEQVNQGAFYTPQKLVDIAYGMIERRVTNRESFVVLDTSSGYGSFLGNEDFAVRIGGDIDPKAVAEAQRRVPSARFVLQDALVNVSRANYGLKPEDRLIIVGNPPYNDTTSIIRAGIKEKVFSCDEDLKHRDMGMSFLRSYNKLKADYICVLHPLSYLIKEANFKSIKDFTDNYKLIDALIVPSTEFSDVSKSTAFPIVIALYMRDAMGMGYEDILNFRFRTIDKKTFSLGTWTSIGKFVQKYPNQKKMTESNSVAKFYTLRDINALRRSKTFMRETKSNTVFVSSAQLKYYCYLDIFKDYIPHIPYYFGNCEPMIDDDQFHAIEDCFIYASAQKHPWMNLWEDTKTPPEDFYEKIEHYFKNLLGEHYVE